MSLKSQTCYSELRVSQAKLEYLTTWLATRKQGDRYGVLSKRQINEHTTVFPNNVKLVTEVRGLTPLDFMEFEKICKLNTPEK